MYCKRSGGAQEHRSEGRMENQFTEKGDGDDDQKREILLPWG
jgi:hypothetical protein